MHITKFLIDVRSLSLSFVYVSINKRNISHSDTRPNMMGINVRYKSNTRNMRANACSILSMAYQRCVRVPCQVVDDVWSLSLLHAVALAWSTPFRDRISRPTRRGAQLHYADQGFSFVYTRETRQRGQFLRRKMSLPFPMCAYML